MSNNSYRTKGYQRPDRQRAMYFSIAPNYWMGNGVDHIRITDSHDLNFNGKKPQMANLCHQLTMNHRLRRQLIIPHFGSFASIDSFYYWLMMKRKDTPYAEMIRTMSGPEVRRYFVANEDKKKQTKTIPGLRAMIVHAYWLRVMNDRDLQIAMANNLFQYDIYHYARATDSYGDETDDFVAVRPAIANWLCPAIDAIGDALRKRDENGDVVYDGNQVVMCEKPEFPFGVMTGMDSLPNYQDLFIQIAPELHSLLVERDEFQYQLEQRRLRKKQKRDARLLQKQQPLFSEDNMAYEPTGSGDAIDQIMQIGTAASDSEKSDKVQSCGFTSTVVELDGAVHQVSCSEPTVSGGDKVVFVNQTPNAVAELSNEAGVAEMTIAQQDARFEISHPHTENVVNAYQDDQDQLIVVVEETTTPTETTSQQGDAVDDGRFSLPG